MLQDEDMEGVENSYCQGGTGKRAVYEPNGSQRCKQIVCTRAWAISTVVVFFLLILAIALIAAFARSGQTQCITASKPETPSPVPSVGPTVEAKDHFPWNNIRLPKAVIPTDYEIFLHPNLTTFLFKGSVDITVQVQEPVTFLVLHEKNLNISTYDLSDLTGRKLTIEDTLHHKEREQVFIMLNEKLSAGNKYKLKLHFEGELTDLMMGFYRSSYTTAKGEKRWLATTQFEPTDARAAFPCFDEPEMKATFTLSMVREKRHLSLFNMPFVNTEAYPDGLEVDHFETSVKMSTYLVAFVVCDFKAIHNRTGRGTEVAVYTPPEQLNQASFALKAAVQVMEYYEQFFGIPYPLPKQDLIAIPDFAAGAMENWGLITYRTTALLYDPTESSSIHQETVAIVVAHELAHQWFGNLVTMKWWNDLWLNEGFATFMEFIGADRVNPSWELSEQFVTKSLLWALHADGFSNSHPIRSPVKNPTDINDIFDAISYNKGASIIRMLENVIGHEALEKGLHDYLNNYKYSNAETDDLWEALSKVGHVDVKAIMDTWTLQMGYPMLLVTRTSPDRVIAQQKRFLVYQPEKEEHPSPFGYQWQIPLTYVTDKSFQSSSTTHWMTNESVSFEISSDARWVKANKDFTGYYRVHYDQSNWEALSLQLQQDPTVFSASDRAELIDDAFAMANAGYHKAPVALSLADYLVNEVNYSPWFTALSNYANMGSLLEDEEAYQYFKKYMQKQLDHVIGFLGWEDKGSYLNKLLRNMALRKAIKVNLKSAVQHASKIFQSWMVNGTKVPKELKTVVYTAGIQYGGDREWNFMWEQYNSSQIPSEKKAFLMALTHTPNAATLNRYIHMTLEDDKVRKQDTAVVINNIASTAPGRVLAWRFMKQHWPEFERRYGGGSFDMDILIKGVVGGFSTQYDHDEVKAFFAAHESKIAKRPIAQALESIKINMAWLERNLKDVTAWLRNKIKH